MAVSEATRKLLKQRAGGKCECTMEVCTHHTGRCSRNLIFGWEAHHRTAGGSDNLGNLTAMCPKCHENTRTYGKH